MEEIIIGNISQLPAEGKVLELSVGHRRFCVARVNGEIAIVDNECPHHGGPLGQGDMEAGKVICPWHGYAFDTKTGVCGDAPKLAVRVYEAKIEGDDVLVTL